MSRRFHFSWQICFVIGILLMLMLCGGLTFIPQTIWHLLVGWILFLGTTLPRITASSSSLISACVLLLMLIAGLQIFLSKITSRFRKDH